MLNLTIMRGDNGQEAELKLSGPYDTGVETLSALEAILSPNITTAIMLTLKKLKFYFQRAIHYPAANSVLFVNAPSFSRQGKASMETTIAALHLMGSGSLKKELDNIDLDMTALAFVQSRGKISPEAFR